MSRTARVAAWVRSHPAATAVLVYAALSLLIVAPALVPGKTLSSGDSYWFQAPWDGVRPQSLERPSNPDIDDVPGVYVPFTEFLRRELPGELPLWNPYLMSGRPFEANSQSAVFSPFTLLSLTLPFWFSMAVVAALKLWLAAFGTFMLGRALGMRPAGALLAGVVFGFSLWIVLWVAFTNTSVWVLMPWLLWATDRLVRRASAGAVALLAALVALQFFGGHPEASFIALVATAFFFLLRAAMAWRTERGPPWRAAGAFALALAGGGALAAVVLLPFLQLLFDSADVEQRSGLGGQSKLPLRFVFGLLLPDYWGRPTQTPLVRFEFSRAVYVGALPLVLGAVALLRPSLERVAVAAFGALWLAVAFGVQPVFAAVTGLPVFSVAHNSRFIVVFVLCAALLAGWGADELASGRRLPAGARAAVLGACGALVVLPVAWTLGAGKTTLSVLGVALDVAWGFVHPPDGDDPAAGDIVRLAALIVWVTFAVAAAALVAARLRGRIGASAFAVLAVLLVAADLFRAGMGQNPAVDQNRAVQPATGAIRYLQSRRPARFTGAGLIPQTVLPMRYRIYDARGYDLPIERRYDTLWRREVTPELPSQAGPFLPLSLTVTELTPRALRTLSLLGVADVLQPPGDPPPRLPGLRLAYSGPDANVWANDRALPRAWLVGGQRVVRSEEAALDAVTRPRWDARATAVTERRLPGLAAAGPAGRAAIAAYQPDRVVVRVRATRPALLVLGDTWYPGWRAEVDGKPVRVERVNYVMRGIRVAAGTHDVELRFAPPAFRVGWIISLVAALALALAVLLTRRRRPQAAREAVQTKRPLASYSSRS
jgi:Bacterial membrane protein YfhO